MTTLLNTLFQTYGRAALFLLLACAAAGCQADGPSGQTAGETAVEPLVLEEYGVAVTDENILLDAPVFLRTDPSTGNLFVYEGGSKEVLEIDEENNPAGTYGGSGRGPGEIQLARNMFVTGGYLYVYDPDRFFIYRYERGGTEIASYNYGTPAETRNPGEPPRPRRPVHTTDIHNEWAVTLSGDILKPIHASGEYLYERLDWQGNSLSRIGQLPAGYRPSMETEAYRQALEKGEPPARDLHRAFPVNDRSDPSELFMVYSAIPKIAKYDTSGRLLWEKQIPRLPEIDSLLVGNHLEYTTATDFQVKIPLLKYHWGFSGPGGELYLVISSIHMPAKEPFSPWIHRFGPDGELIGRYTFSLGEEEFLLPYAAVGTGSPRFLLVSLTESTIRSYPFPK